MRPRLTLILRAGCKARHLTCSRCYSTAQEPTIKSNSIPAPHSGSIRVLSLNRPSARNAISRQLLAELSKHVEEVAAEGESGGTRALVLASESDASFCAGADLKERATFTPEDTRQFLTSLRQTFSQLSNLPIPTISAVNGTALGGGLELALCTTFRVISSMATVGLPETRLAILPGAGGTHRLPALIGETRAMDLILTGRRIAGAEAYFLGIADRLVGPDQLHSTNMTKEEMEKEGKAERERVKQAAISMARDICEGGPLAIRMAMQAVEGWRDGGESEGRAYEKVVGTKDRDEALAAFREKRKPAFRGK